MESCKLGAIPFFDCSGNSIAGDIDSNAGLCWMCLRVGGEEMSVSAANLQRDPLRPAGPQPGERRRELGATGGMDGVGLVERHWVDAARACARAAQARLVTDLKSRPDAAA